jgi:hypothetical protein
LEQTYKNFKSKKLIKDTILPIKKLDSITLQNFWDIMFMVVYHKAEQHLGVRLIDDKEMYTLRNCFDGTKFIK